MDPSSNKLIADVVINLFAAGSLLIISHSLYRAAPSSPVYLRVRVALWLGALLFAIRAVAWWTTSPFLEALEIVLAALSPVAALVLAEGLLRRHAPLMIKLIVVTATLVALLIHLVPGLPSGFKMATLLSAVAGSLVAIAVFMIRRISHDLEREEQRIAGRVLGSLLLVTPCIATDFENLFPGFPVRMGALSIVFLLYISFGAGSNSNQLYERGVSIVVFLVIAMVFSAAHVMAGDVLEIDAVVRAVAVGFSGLIFAALFSETMGSRSERRRTSGAYLQARNLAEFTDLLGNHDRLSNVRHLDREAVQPLSHPAFDDLIERYPVLRMAEAPWVRSQKDPGVERAMSLLETYNATHVMRLSPDPTQLLVFAVPPAATDPRLESELQAAQRIGELLYAREAG